MFESLIIQHIANTAGGNLLLAVVIVIAMAVLIKGADWLVDGAVDLARDLGLPKVIIGATIVALGTTGPETAVSVLAAVKGHGGLAIGNGIGSVICDLALILGLSMVLGRIPIHRQILNRQAWVVLAAAVLFCLFAYLAPDQEIARWMGLVLIVCLAAYLYFSYRWAVSLRAEEATPSREHLEEASRSLWASAAWLVIGLVVLIVGSEALIPSVTLAATRLGISQAVIAATLVALGTSLPELATALTSLRKGHGELILGNIIGADVLNLLWVIGLSATAVPLKVEPVFYHIQAPFMLGMLIMFRLFVWTTRGTFRRWQGVLLLAGYVAFVTTQYLWGRG